MLGKLIQGYGKGLSSLESSTEEEHTRSLLYPSTSYTRLNSYSATPPLKSPTFRIGPFDDKGGLDLNESKDLRIVIAQDAFGVLDKPVILFDSSRPGTPPNSNVDGSATVNSATVRTSPRFQRQQMQFDVSKAPSARNRSSTISGATSPWIRSNQEAESNDRISQLLDCMFGVTSAAKSGSTTKMHVLFSGQDAHSSPILSTSQISPIAQQGTRMPLIRARTSNNPTSPQISSPSSKQDNLVQQDVILVTRMFSVTLPDNAENQPLNSSQHPDDVTDNTSSVPIQEALTAQSGLAKKQKLVEKKTPMFAVGLIFYLPHPLDSRGTSNAMRPPSRTSYAFTSLPNSYGSDIFSSWTLLDAIPESLSSSSQSDRNLGDGRVELITEIWDVILRSLSSVERLAQREIFKLLQQVNQEMVNSTTKAPKGPHEQRTNQRNVYIRHSSALGHVSVLHQGSKQALRRIGDALRIPRVMTGLGFVDGHWLDESRYLVQVCGTKNQNFFLFNLLTAFLGTHLEWLERLRSDLINKYLRTARTRRDDATGLTSRTVIISDRRSIARRLIFLLASFLPSSHPEDFLSADFGFSKSALLTSTPESSSLLSGIHPITSQHRSHRPSQTAQLPVDRLDIAGVSSSVSSNGSIAATSPKRRGLLSQAMERKDSDAFSLRNAPTLSLQSEQGSLRKTSAASGIVSPNPTTPVAHFSTKQGSYFPDDAVAEGDDSVATADLAKHLSRSNNSMSRVDGSIKGWGTLLNNVSGFWTKKQEQDSPAKLRNPPGGTRRGDKSFSISAMPSESNRKPEKTREFIPAHKKSLSQSTNRTSGGDGTSVSGSMPISVKSNLQPPKLRVDQKDGVVDVDVKIPGFLSWSDNEDPLSPNSFLHQSPSARSLSGAPSRYGSKSHAFSASDKFSPKDSNVSGFLKRYHEDFSLQAVRPYPDLQDDIRQSMLQEPTPSGGEPVTQTENEGNAPWVDVCSTIIADTRTFSIQRLTLRRKRSLALTGESKDAPVQLSETKHTGLATKRGFSLDKEHEQFTSEVIMDFDATLTDAIEQVLDDSDRTGRIPASNVPAHSRTKSNSTISTTVSTPPNNSSTRNLPRTPYGLRSESYQLIMDALEEVVKSVIDDLVRHQKGRDVNGQTIMDGSVSREMKQENLLREGLRNWLLDIETKSST